MGMRRPPRIAILIVALTLLAAACGDSGGDGGDSAADGSTATTAPADDTTATTAGSTDTAAPAAERPVVKVGSVNSLTGPVPFPEASQAAAAVFDRYNNDPDGKLTIEYSIEDDGADPALATQAARKLVDDDGVVLMAGGASLVDCAVNGALYDDNGLYAIQGTGVDISCFTSRNIAPVNTGPYAGLTASLFFTSEILGHDSICYVQFDAGTQREPLTDAVQRWTDITGKELTSFDFYAPGDDFTPFVTKAIDSGCTAVFEGGLDATAIAWNEAVAGQGASFDTVHFTSAYTAEAAQAIGSPATRTYANSEFEPFTDISSPALADWVQLMNDNGIPLTSFGEGGYLAALAAIQVLESAGIQPGDDTDVQRQKVEAAVLGMEPFENPMLGSPYVFGDAEAHNPNQASKFVELVDGEWTTVTDDFIVLPDVK